MRPILKMAAKNRKNPRVKSQQPTLMVHPRKRKKRPPKVFSPSTRMSLKTKRPLLRRHLLFLIPTPQQPIVLRQQLLRSLKGQDHDPRKRPQLRKVVLLRLELPLLVRLVRPMLVRLMARLLWRPMTSMEIWFLMRLLKLNQESNPELQASQNPARAYYQALPRKSEDVIAVAMKIRNSLKEKKKKKKKKKKKVLALIPLL